MKTELCPNCGKKHRVYRSVLGNYIKCTQMNGIQHSKGVGVYRVLGEVK